MTVLPKWETKEVEKVKDLMSTATLQDEHDDGT